MNNIPSDFFTDYTEIIENLYVGNKRSVHDFEPNKMTLIVNCTKSIPFQTNSYKKIRLPIDNSDNDSVNLYDYINKTRVLEEMNKCLFYNKCVLVHCRMGIRRSCLVVACYLIKYHKLTPKQAIFFIKKKRPIAFSGGNLKFMDTLNLIYNNSQNTYCI